jgi:hypothetical protein
VEAALMRRNANNDQNAKSQFPRFRVLVALRALVSSLRSELNDQLSSELNDQNANNDPLRKPDTAFGPLDEEESSAERDLVERYQAFVAELLRLSLLGIAVFGFLFKIIFEANLDSSKLTQIASKLAFFPAAIGVAMFGISALCALVFRFFSIQSLGLYIEALRFKKCSKTVDAEESLNKRHRKNHICTQSKFFASLTLALGGVFEAVAVIVMLFVFAFQTGA